jgi:hypothetical protein
MPLIELPVTEVEVLLERLALPEVALPRLAASLPLTSPLEAYWLLLFFTPTFELSVTFIELLDLRWTPLLVLFEVPPIETVPPSAAATPRPRPRVAIPIDA